MRITILAAALLLVAASLAWASEPGEPLDCGDWEMLEPGITCAYFGDWTEDDAVGGIIYDTGWVGHSHAMDNEGRIFRVREAFHESFYCGAERYTYTVIERHDPTGWVPFARSLSRCDTGAMQLEKFWFRSDQCILFDKERGRLLVSLHNIGPNQNGEKWIAAFEGFATTFDVLQTFTPSADLGFRVPYMPEGMERADRFDTYRGNLATVGDWSQASGLRCDYPAAVPQVGDYLTVTDPSADPASGQGYYYVTAATLAGETRLGRRAEAGVLRGRDPSALPACSE